MAKPTDIDGYISQFPADVQATLRQVRETIRRAAPDAEEVISYRHAKSKSLKLGQVYSITWAVGPGGKSKCKIQIRQSKKWLAQAPAPKTALLLSVLRALCGSRSHDLIR